MTVMGLSFDYEKHASAAAACIDLDQGGISPNGSPLGIILADIGRRLIMIRLEVT